MSESSSSIPKEFFSFETGAPFTHCLECDALLDERTPYIIEKAVRNYPEYGTSDVIFDYALCMTCVENMRQKMSTASREAILAFFEDRIRSVNIHDFSTEHCLVSSRSRKECEEYQLYAHCVGSNLSDDQPPYMISGAIIDEILPMLSMETREDLDGFFDRHFSPDPSLLEPVPSRPLIL